MGCAAMSSQPSETLSRLARRISDQLLTTSTTPDIVCPDTAQVIKGSNLWRIVKSFAGAKATGAHYKAFGFYYVLGWETEGLCVFVYRAGDKRLVGTIHKEGKFKKKGDPRC